MSGGDDAARRDVARLHDVNLFVEAGAGTGKTTTLVARVVELVASGKRRLPELAVITFTEAAAAELEERVRDALERATRGDGAIRSPAEQQRCAAALETLDDATISTLHGFAHRLLSDHPLEAGLPPGFEVIDEIQAAVDFERRWRVFLDELLGDPDRERALLVAFVLGSSPGRLQEVARELHRHWDRLGGGEPVVAEVPAVGPDALVDALAAVGARRHECLEEDRLFRHLDDLERRRGRIVAAHDDGDEVGVLEVLAELKVASGNAGRAQCWPAGVKREVQAQLLEAQGIRDAVVDALRQPASAQLLASLRSFTRRGATARRREGRLEFHDLLVLARDLLRDHSEVRAELARRYPAMLIDEFQDTDPLQIEIALLIAGGADAAPPVPAVPPGSVFFVGDPKQSIYRFRRADITLYRRARERFGAGLRHLTRNHRSAPGILDWVDAVFAPLLTGGDPELQAPYERLVASRPALPGVPAPVRLLGEELDRDASLEELREHEADEIAALVLQAEREGWPVHAPTADDPDATRPVRFSDIALLLPTRTTLPYLEHALERAGIPARVESQSLVFATAEVRELLSILRAVDDPTDGPAIVASLRAPAFGCRDDELAAFHQAGGRWDYRRPAPEALPADHPVVAGMAALRDLHRRRWWETVSETVERVIRDRRLLELATAHRRPRDHWRRIRFFADLARSFVDAGGTSVRAFVDWIDDQIEQEARAVEVVVPEPDDDAVRILTVHGAKGLEFPVVVLTGLNVALQHRSGSVLWNAAGDPEVRLGYAATGFESPGWPDTHALDKQADAAERVRLLYVAATRARDHLVVCLHRRENDRSCPAAALAPHAEPTGATRVATATASVSTDHGDDAVSGMAGAGDADGFLAERDAWIAARAARVAELGRSPTVAATALARRAAGDADGDGHAGTDPALVEEPAEAETPAWRRGRAGTSVGRAVHATLQSIDLAAPSELAATARAQAWAEEIPEREREIVALVESVLAAPTVRAAAAPGGRAWREVPVAAVVDGVTVEGFVDLLVETPAGLVVVDYKTDRAHDDADLDALLARYRIQGAAYALALERVLGRPVARCVFVFARAGAVAVEREVTDLRAAVTEAETLVAAPAS